MLFIVLILSMVWVLVCTAAYRALSSNSAVLYLAFAILMVPAALLSLGTTSVSLGVLTMGTLLVVLASPSGRNAVNVRRFFAAMSFLVCISILLGATFAPSHLKRMHELQSKFPQVKLADRLPPPSNFVMTSMPVPSTERSYGASMSGIRTIGLQYLHASQLQHFIDSPGFGNDRSSGIKIYFATKEAPLRSAIPLKITPRRYQVLPGLTGNQLESFHMVGVRDFANPAGYGWVDQRKTVAGFEEHQFSERPTVSLEKDIPHEEWNIIQFQLISLLKHDPPMTYVSSNLPSMGELNHADVRPLNSFESMGLDALHSGETSTVFVRRVDDHVRMLGAIRAQHECLQCHTVPEGALLGAFSYELRQVASTEYVLPGTDSK